MDRQEIYELILAKVRNTFSPTEAEIEKISERLKRYTDEEIRHFERNFESFGIDEVINCLYHLMT